MCHREEEEGGGDEQQVPDEEGGDQLLVNQLQVQVASQQDVQTLTNFKIFAYYF